MSFTHSSDQSKLQPPLLRANLSPSLSIDDLYNDLLLDETLNIKQLRFKKCKSTLSFLDIDKRLETLRYSLAVQESELWKLNCEIQETQVKLERIAYRASALQNTINRPISLPGSSFFSLLKRFFAATVLLHPALSIH